MSDCRPSRNPAGRPPLPEDQRQAEDVHIRLRTGTVDRAHRLAIRRRGYTTEVYREALLLGLEVLEAREAGAGRTSEPL